MYARSLSRPIKPNAVSILNLRLRRMANGLTLRSILLRASGKQTGNTDLEWNRQLVSVRIRSRWRSRSNGRLWARHQGQAMFGLGIFSGALARSQLADI